jgi:hypothetical protein
VKLMSGLLLFVLTGAASCSAQRPDPASAAVAAAQAAAKPWLALVDQKRYGESWDSAAAPFRSAVSRTQWEQAVRQARGPFEPFGGRKLRSATYTTTLPNAAPGHYVVLQYEAQVADGRAVIETITPMKESDDTWRVSGYYVRPQ